MTLLAVGGEKAGPGQHQFGLRERGAAELAGQPLEILDVPRNLKRRLPKIEMRAARDGLFLISAGGDYEASLLLFDDVWSTGQIKVDGDIVAAIPAKDVLLVTGSKNRAGLKTMRELVTKFVADQRYAVSDALFVYRNGKFIRFGRK